MKRTLFLLALGLLSAVFSRAQITNTFVENLDARYASSLKSSSQTEKESLRKACLAIYQSIPADAKESVMQTLMERVATSARKSNDEFVTEAKRFLFITPDTFPNKDVIVEQLARVYAARHDKAGLQDAVSKLQDIQKTTGKNLTAIISRITKDISSASAWASCEGYWVAGRTFSLKDYNAILGSFSQQLFASEDKEIDLGTNYCFPFFSLHITKENVQYLADKSGFFIRPFKVGTVFTSNGFMYSAGSMKNSQVYSYDSSTGKFLSYFGSEQLVDANLNVGNDWLSAAQVTDAGFMTEMKTGNYSFGQKLGGAVVDGVMTGLMRSFAQRTAVVKKYADVMSIKGIQVKPGVINAQFEYKHLVARNADVRTPIFYRADIPMYRLTPEMNITLGDKKGKPLFYWMNDAPELKKIRRRGSLANPLFWLSSAACLAGGIPLCAKGLKDMDNEDTNTIGQVKLASGLFLGIFGVAIPLAFPIGVRHSGVEKYNNQQLKKIQDYYGK